MPMLVEICVDGLQNARAAAEGGADRIELCADLPRDGTTPSRGVIEIACRDLTVPLHVLIRPRPGDFVYSEPEIRSMLLDIRTARDAGAAGVVIGALDPSRRIDADTTRRLIDAARPLSVTFHRAFDATADPLAALETLIALGVNRILTSGRPGKARDHLPTLASLVERAQGHLIILAAGSVNAGDLSALAATGITEAHAGSAVVGPGGQVDPHRVRALINAAHAL